MLTSATPIFENVPATFADPVGLADQQARGVVALIVVRYAQTEEALAVLGGVYDAFVCVSGQLLTVARSTPDYRFPVMPAVALRRFIEHRDAGRPAFLSVYELSETECARFVETVFYSECMKLMIGESPSGDSLPRTDGGAPGHHLDAHFVADQLVRSGCGNGVLELNDFTDPDRPRIRLVDLHELSNSVGVVPDHSHPILPGGTIDPDGLAAVLAGHMAGFVGRVLLYDRAKNKAALPDRTGTPFDLMAAIREANRLAQAKRGGDATAALAQAEAELRASAPPSTQQADQVEHYLRERAERPRAVEPSHPTASGLGALIAELQGGPAIDAPHPVGADRDPPSLADPSSLAPTAPPDSPPRTGGERAIPTPSPDSPFYDPTDPDPGDDFKPFKWADADVDIPADTLLRAAHGENYVAPIEPAPDSPFYDPTDPAPIGNSPSCHREEQGDVATSPPLEASAPHPLAAELEALRSGIYDLLAGVAGPERAQEAHDHALAELGMLGAHVPAEHAIAYVRTLLVEPPPKRWMLYKRQRGKIAPDASGRLLAFHRAHAHVDDPSIDEAGMLWARLHK